MSEQLQIITSSNRSHTVRLFAIWLFLIVMPALVLVISFDMLLKDSEGYIKDTLKIKMVQELGDFRSKLSFARMVELKMHRLTSKTRLLDSDAESLARTINQQLQIPAVIVFHLNPQTGKFSSHVADSISARLGMLSRTMLQNYLTSVLRNSKTPSRSGSAENPAEAAKYKRSLAYLRSLFSTAGEIEIMFNRATPSFSGHPELGRLLFYAVPLENSGAALLVFRENDISLRQLAEFAANDRLFTDLQRSFTLSAEGRQAVYRLGNEMQHFSEAGDGALVVKGMASEEFLLRRVNNGTLFPARLKETLANPPLLQITAPLPSQQHPLRKVTSQAEKAALLLVILASVLLLRIFLFGYSSGLKIRTRLLLCVLGASILPFSTFIASMAYHEHFVAEFEKSEIDQYLNLQQDYLNKSLNARIDVEERKMAELAETLGRLNWQESDKYLSDWKKKSVSVLLLISSGDQEKIYTDSPDETLNATEISMKNLSFMTLRSALRPTKRARKVK